MVSGLGRDMNPADLTATDESRRGFYPTPLKLAEKMLKGLDFRYVSRILEPSAGKGDLIKAIAQTVRVRGCRDSVEVDAIELDPYLRQILKYEWSEEKKHELLEKDDPYRERAYNAEWTDKEREEHAMIREEIAIRDAVSLHIVHDDFFTYRTWKAYDLIIMNPPFSNGDLHLLRALEVQKRGGKIICLLNAETIRNQYTATRKILAGKLKDLNAEIEYIEGAFSDAERRTGVTVAIVRVDIPKPEYESDIYSRMKKAAERRIETDPELQELITADFLEQAVQTYRVEVDATMEFIREYTAMSRYMRRDLDSGESDPIIKIMVYNNNGYGYGDFDLNKYMRTVRLKYWKALLRNKKFTGRLTSKLRERYQSEVRKMADYEFSMFNIKQVYFDMLDAMSKGINEAILELFDTLTVKYAHWDECKTTVHYFNGWKTNKAHKIGSKVIIPAYVHDSWMSSGEAWFDERKAYDVISDIEKAFDYLSAKPNEEYNLEARLHWAKTGSQTRNIRLKYFKIDFFKKGTMHIKFLPEAMPMVERLNIFGAQKHNWLPPNYGKSSYSVMTEEEKSIVDSFHGDGAAGSGENAYAEVMRNAEFYLAAPMRELPALMAPQSE